MTFVGEPTGPHYPRTDGRSWTTIPTDPLGETTKPLLTVALDSEGRGVGEISWASFPGRRDEVLQSLSTDLATGPWKTLPSGCVVLQGRGERARVVPHFAAMATRGHLLTPFALVAAVVLTALARRRFGAAFPHRAAGLLIVLAAAAVLVRMRATQEGPMSRINMGWPLEPAPVPDDLSSVAATDRAAGAGFYALLTASRDAVPPHGSVAIVGGALDGLPSRAVMHAAVRLAPRRVDLAPSAEAADGSSYVLVLDGRPVPADALFRNSIGALIRPAAESRRSDGAVPR